MAPSLTTTMDTTTATIQATSHGGNTGETSDAALLDADDTEYLTPNAQPTGFERNNNPEHWPEDHQRVPLYRQPVVNPAWYQIRGDSAGIRLFMWTMLSGCQLLQWGYFVPRGLGLHARGLLAYKVANEW